MVFGALWSTGAAVVRLSTAPLVGAYQLLSFELGGAPTVPSARTRARRAAAEASDNLRPVAWHSGGPLLSNCLSNVPALLQAEQLVSAEQPDTSLAEVRPTSPSGV